ncbi:putative membrane protein, partial [Acinetobacter baumannii 25691_7]
MLYFFTSLFLLFLTTILSNIFFISSVSIFF